MWDPKKILNLENFVDQQRCVWRLAWDFSMRMAMAKIRPNGFERRESFEDMWKDIYRLDGCFEVCVCGYWMLEVNRELIDTSGWLNYAFLHREEFTSRWHRQFVRTLDIQRSTDSTVDHWFTSPPITDLFRATVCVCVFFSYQLTPNEILFCWGTIREIKNDIWKKNPCIIVSSHIKMLWKNRVISCVTRFR